MENDKPKEETNEIKAPDIEKDVAPEGYTQDEWDGYSKEDKISLREMIANPEDKDKNEEEIDEDTLKEIAGEEETPKEEQGKKDEEGKTPEEEGKPKVDEEITPKVDEEKSEIVVVDDTELLSYRPVISSKDIDTWLASQPKEVQEKYVVTIPQEVQKKYDEGIKTLKAQFEADEISRDEYEETRDKFRDELNEFKLNERERIRDSLKEEVLWNFEQAKFWNVHTEYIGEKNKEGKFEKTARSSLLWAAMQAAIDQINDSGMSGMQVLVKADKMVKETLGMFKKSEEQKEVKSPKPKEGEEELKGKTPKDIQKEKPPAKKPDENLGSVPEASPNAVQDGWEAVDKLPDNKREEWLSKQPQNVVDAYLNSLGR